MAVVFDSVGFSAALDSLNSEVSNKLKSELNTTVTEETKSQLDGKNPNDAQAYTNFYNSVMPVGTFKKSIIPEDVYKAIMLEAAVRDKTISKGFDIGDLDGKTVSAVASWFQGIFGKKTINVGKYKVTMQSNYSAQVTSPSGRVYPLTWTLDNTAKKALKAYIADLKTYLSDYHYQIYGEIIKDGLSPLINEFIAEVAEGVDSAREKLINSFHEWALNKAADVAIDKILPKTYKQIKAVDKNYKEFVSKFNTLKTYVKTVKDDSITSNKKYTAFVKAYNNLGIGNYVDVVANYLSYEFLETESGIFGQNKALITGTDSDNKISASGSYVTIKGGGGNDFISASGSKSRISGDAGNDKVLLEGSQGSISGGAGSDSIVVDGERNTVLGGANDDYIALFKSKNTITGGKGNDTILNHYDTNIVFKYLNGDGNDIISGFNSMSTLSIVGGSYSTTKSGDDVIVTVGDGKISLIGAARYNVNIIHQISTKTLTNKNSANITIGADIDVADASTRTKAIEIVGNAFDNTILGGSKSDSLYGGKGADSLIGNAGNDKIYGQAGNDILKGGAGNDSLWGGAGNDSLWGDAGNDTFIYASGEGKDVIYGFENNDLLKITGAFSASYSKSKGEIYFKVGSTSKAITLSDFSATSFNVNGTNYKISGTKLVKK